MFVLPEFTNDLSTLQISLWGNTAANDITTAGTLLLGVVTDASNPNTFTTVANIPATAFERVGEDAPHTNFIGPYNFSSINWQPGMRIAFRYQNSNANNAWNLDDFVVTLIPNISLISVMLVAQFVSGILLPVLLVFMVLILTNKRIMGKYTNRRILTVLIWVLIVVVVALTLGYFIMTALGF